LKFEYFLVKSVDISTFVAYAHKWLVFYKNM